MATVTKEQVLKVLERVNDPELRLNIVDLGLVYNVDITEDNNVTVEFTLTSQFCPIGPYIQMQVEQAVMSIPEVNHVEARLVFDPPWTPDRMSERLKKARELGLL
ncbi:MAG TPA: metal-sulfur cluster assembly factor [Symbiobacteriaceae bacterium]